MLDLHAPQIQGFFGIPVDDLYALPVLVDAVRDLDLTDLVVVSPDAGFAKKARLYAKRLVRADGDRRQGAHRPQRDRAGRRPDRRRRRHGTR